ncbi:short-chain dehydrogenase [Pseudomonas sp. NS1(2017)]|jgi:NAD(P)-dependent dehydrogenase (short-subunit alcohol dehydrogenase family)|uniref:SDR family NAD(P)-dependent oxidoreductase n=1 Tax=Pseudomonas sp. NS1(2017) TaxID=2025658 RepID=UPI000BA24354|nr:SDR family oxidoreductase [Pseudomonas sp. NS1(2017)]ASV37211.1 short-chain dehydrogenase [Pseudomonas sp. NS1(2017)]
MNITQSNRRVALITGAAGELGRAICQRLCQDGFDIAAVDLNLDAAKALVDGLDGAPGQLLLAIQADLGDEASISAMVDEVGQSFGRIDVVVNNAAVNHRGSIYDFSVEQWDHMMAVNLRGPALLCQKVAPYWKAQASGCVVNMVSRCWVAGGPPAYVACKAGLVGLTRSMARELAPHNVTVNAIAPGFLPSAFTMDGRDAESFERIAQNAIGSTPLKRLTTPQDVANTASFLASSNAGFITAEVIHVCGGSQLAPFGVG